MNPSSNGSHGTRDNMGRNINYLRISITDRCNLRCKYCVPKDQLPLVNHNKIARYEEILKIAELAVSLGITKVRVTGGEPLVRRGIFTFLKRLSKLDGIEDISLTTNGVYLKKFINQIQNSGIKRINISLDTLMAERFLYITGKDRFQRVWDGIMAALEIGISPIKLNCVVINGINDDEIVNLARLSMDYPLNMRFIEYMPMGSSEILTTQQLLVPEIKSRIEAHFGKLIPIQGDKFDGPAKRYKIQHSRGEIGFISPVSSHFCSQCNRLRLTSTGKLRPCLLNNFEQDILGPLRQGANNEELLQIMKDVILKKPFHHELTQGLQTRISSQMSAIGG